MEPVELIVAAIAAGTLAGTQDVAAQVIKDAYTKFKSLLLHTFGARGGVKDALEMVEKKPDASSRQTVLTEELTQAGVAESHELLQQAQALLELLSLHREAAQPGYAAQLTESCAIAQGEGARAGGERTVIADTIGGPVVTGDGDIVVGGNLTLIGDGNVLGDHGIAYVRKDIHYHKHYHKARLGPDEAALRNAYLSSLFETSGRLALSGIDPKTASDTETSMALSAVYTALLALPLEEYEQLKGGTHPEALAQSPRRLSALAQLDAHSRLVLLGDPGSGKTTFVNFVALCLAGEALGRSDANLARLAEPLPVEKGDERLQPWSHGALLPVRVVLRDFAARGLPPSRQPTTAKHLWDFLAAELDAVALGAYATCLEEELQKQGGLLLLDGLDEVPEAERRREQIKQAVESFAGAFPRCRIMVTSRTYAYQKQAWRLPGFTEAALAPFGRGQVERFIDRWYDHIGQLRGLVAEDARGRAALLKQAIFGSDRLQGLAERPLLLTLMASLHAWRGGSLPEKREELYADTVDLLLDWWEQPKAVRDAEGHFIVEQPSLGEWLKVDRQEVRVALAELAFKAHAEQGDLVGTADVPEEALVEGLLRLTRNPDVRPARLVEYLSQRAGLLIPRGVAVYTFPHRTFQEYLAAWYLTDYAYPEKVAKLARSDPERWREVALLAGAKSARGSNFALWALVEELCPHPLKAKEEQMLPDAWGALLAGQALAESAVLDRVSERDRPKLVCVQEHLVRILEAGRLPAVERTAAGRALAKLGDSRPGVGVRPDGLPDIAWQVIPTEMSIYQREIELPAFRISRYPITQAQFAAFVKRGGYGEARYWTKAGWGWLKREGWKKPLELGDPWMLLNHPVVGVSWYEASAFCSWLTERLHACGEIGEAETVSLPTEMQWEQAAQGTDGRLYPWGAKPDPDKSNYGDTGIGTTCAVGCFPNGVSPYEVEDMSGNVWEWCCTKWEENSGDYQNDKLEGNEPRVLRGGAFSSIDRYVRCAKRIGGNSFSRHVDIGFRPILSLHL